MSQNLYAQFSGVPMSRDDIERLLKTKGYGILSLCDDGTPYSTPLSFGYDGESV
jgi:nitroimidazol reductase NimA-like FMN-containing flavoprotein (pyridoxamine 5'-phosphate oxidase superfamily)